MWANRSTESARFDPEETFAEGTPLGAVNTQGQPRRALMS